MKQHFFLVMALLLTTASFANNVAITNVSIVNNGPGTLQVQFDLSWDNSWRTNVGPANYDGVWVFFKYKKAGGNWSHITMTGSNNVIPAGVDIYQTNDFLKTGAMIYRESTNVGIGSMSVSNIKLGVNSTLPYDIDLKGFAIEMVFVPAPGTRPFFGDGNGTSESLNAFHYTDNTATTSSVLQMRTDPNTLDDSKIDIDGAFVYSNDTIQLTNPLDSILPFPTMKALWCMKYEISQAAYRDFLNTLTYVQQTNRSAVSPNSATGTRALAPAGASPLPYRNYLEIASPGFIFVGSNQPAVYGCDADGNNIFDEATDGEWVACNYLTWPDVAAYLDWSGLAPMGEFHYERICRGSTSAGPQPAIYQELAWGTDSIFTANYTFSNINTANEVITNNTPPAGNAADILTTQSLNGPLRNGVFATASSDRVSSGAGFFGVMEMSGNVYEYCITVGNYAGRSCHFIPNGNGTISTNGNAQLSVGGAGFWPGMEGNVSSSTYNKCGGGGCEVTGNAGIMRRGGSFLGTASTLAVSYRSAFVPSASVRDPNYGGRGVLYIR